MKKSVLLSLVCVFVLVNKLNAQKDIEHMKVYYEDGRFAGWPANHGVWIWGNEILVGFVESKHKDQEGHTYDRDIPRDKYARSLDGGKTWSVEDALEHGQSAWRYNNKLPESVAKEPVQLNKPVNFKKKNFALTFLRQTNNIGPSHFYYSYDKGHQWKGPFSLPNFSTPGVATRTDYLIDGKRDLTAFLTVAKKNGREGRILCVRTEDGGQSWREVGWLGDEPERFEIMSSSVRLSKKVILTTIRKRTGAGESMIVAYKTHDNGQTWNQIDNPVDDTGNGGSPPALIKLKNGTLALGYIVRSNEGSRVCYKTSSDDGESWSKEYVLREDGANRDVGYPRMVQRPDGKLVILYYWNNALTKPESPYRYIAATIFDPLKHN